MDSQVSLVLTGTGDVLVVAEWDRATRSMWDGLAIMQRVASRGAAVRVLDKPHLDLTTPLGRGFLAFLSAMAEDERLRIRSRAAAGMVAARARGIHMGRPFKLTDHQRTVASARLLAGDSIRRVADDLNVSRRTVQRLARTVS